MPAVRLCSARAGGIEERRESRPVLRAGAAPSLLKPDHDARLASVSRLLRVLDAGRPIAAAGTEEAPH
jgi:hypothetical protein